MMNSQLRGWRHVLYAHDMQCLLTQLMCDKHVHSRERLYLCSMDDLDSYAAMIDVSAASLWCLMSG